MHQFLRLGLCMRLCISSSVLLSLDVSLSARARARAFGEAIIAGESAAASPSCAQMAALVSLKWAMAVCAGSWHLACLKRSFAVYCAPCFETRV